MKKFLRSLSLLLALLMLLSAFATMISCGEETEDPTPDTPPTEDDGGDNNDLPTPGANGKAKYTITVKTIGGRAVSNLNFYIYKGDDLKDYGKTDANGIGTVEHRHTEFFHITGGAE